MSQATARGPINGVDVPTLFATIDAVDGARELANFQFRATNSWETGTYSRTSIKSFYGAGQDHDRAAGRRQGAVAVEGRGGHR